MAPYSHPILQQSFAIIDAELAARGIAHALTAAEYQIARRIIHSTADFEFLSSVRFEHDAIAQGMQALQQGKPIVVDVSMVRQGITTLVKQTFNNPILTAVEYATVADPGRTRTETGLLQCLTQAPGAIYVIGNAPTALQALCQQIQAGQAQPTLVIGAPVGFVGVLEAKQTLAQTAIPQIRVEGRKGGSPVAAAIVNALLLLAWDAELVNENDPNPKR
ncbi:MAG: cobalt-precorrin-8X methylmutase [Cyanobacteria bacterium P01_H01_bin.121]